MQACVSDIGASHHVERPDCENQMTEDVPVVELPVADVNQAVDVGAQIRPHIHLHRRFGRAKQSSWELRQRQTDHRRLQYVGGVRPIESNGLLRSPLARNTTPTVREVGIDTAIARGVRDGERIAGVSAPDTDAVEPLDLRAQARLDVVRTLAKIQLLGCPAELLIHAHESFHLVMVTVLRHTALQHRQWQVIHQRNIGRLPRINRHDLWRPVRGSHLLGPKWFSPSKL